jgi:hypothetical protein
MGPLPSAPGTRVQGRDDPATSRALASPSARAKLAAMQDDPQPLRLPDPPPERPEGHLSYVLIALVVTLLFWWGWG